MTSNPYEPPQLPSDKPLPRPPAFWSSLLLFVLVAIGAFAGAVVGGNCARWPEFGRAYLQAFVAIGTTAGGILTAVLFGISRRLMS